MKIKFKVVGGTGNFKEGGVYTFYDDGRGDKIMLDLMRLLPEYFMEIQPEGKRFDAKYKYTGEVRVPLAGELFECNGLVFTECGPSNVLGGVYNILRPILKPIPAGTRFNDEWEYAGVVEIYHADRTYVYSERDKTSFTASKYTRRDEMAQLLRPIKKSPTKQEIITALEGSIRHWLEDILPLVLERNVNTLPLGGDNCPLCKLISAKDMGCSGCPLVYCGEGSVYFNFEESPTFKNALTMIEELQKCKDELTEKNK